MKFIQGVRKLFFEINQSSKLSISAKNWKIDVFGPKVSLKE